MCLEFLVNQLIPEYEIGYSFQTALNLLGLDSSPFNPESRHETNERVINERPDWSSRTAF
jgi:hypothetical protein